MSKTKKITSLQTQYTVSAFILGIIVIAAAAITYHELTRTSEQLSRQTQYIASLFRITGETKEQINHTIKAINIYMLEPEHSNQKELVKQKLDFARSNILKLSDSPVILKLDLKKNIKQLSARINQLQTESQQLFHIRINANKQYPAMAVSESRLLPTRNQISTIFNVTLEELKETQNLEITPQFNLIIKARYAWLRIISEFRFYMTNRMGTLNEQILLDQENLIDSSIAVIKDYVNTLLSPEFFDYFGFEGQALLETLPGLINKWESGFQEVKRINHSGHWRIDTEIMRASIIPLSDEILLLINNIENKLQSENETVRTALNRATSRQSQVLVTVILLFLIYIIVSIILLKQLLIKPIRIMAKAFKSAAINPSSLNQLQFKKTRETADLLDAFNLMSEQVSKRQLELEHRALHDSLTLLPNRILMQQRLDYQELIAKREQSIFSLMMLDLNRFKEINDTLGHHVGDELLKQVSNRLDHLIRKVDTVARLGGDEFAILLPNSDHLAAAIVSDKIAASLKKEFTINNYTLQISSSIGIAEYPKDGDDVSALMQHADIAMYCSKKNKSRYEFYDPTEDTYSLAQLSLGRDLETALATDQLEMYLQPKIDIQSGQINGAEALLRWHHPEYGYINPEKIVEIAEHVELIDKLTYWIIHRSIQNCSQVALPEYFDLSINLAVQSLRDANLINETISALEQNRSFHHQLTFEVTESAMMNNPEQSINILNALKDLGIRISIDDFGTGFSSLAYLKQLPVNELKIDKSFVMDIQDDESDKAIVFSTIKLSHSLGLNVVAEGVENQQTLDVLRDMECDIAQGYYFSKPVSAEEFKHYMNNYNQGK